MPSTFARRPARHLAASLTLAVLSCLPGTPAAAPARHAIVVLIDGARLSETYGDSLHRWYARQALDLAPLGCLVRDFRNLGATLTSPGVSAVLTGTWQALANDGSERSHVPSVLESWRMATGAPATDAWLIVTKPKLAILAQSDHPESGPRYAASSWVADNDLGSAAKGLEVLARYRPALTVVHLGDTDLAGHSGDWALYTASLRRADSLVHVLWQAVKRDTALAASTALFVTHDHGRHLDSTLGFRNHGDGCEGCRRLSLLALGAGVRSGVEVPGTRSQADLAPTLGALLGFPVPWARGQVMEELLSAPTATGDSESRPARAR